MHNHFNIIVIMSCAWAMSPSELGHKIKMHGLWTFGLVN